MTCHQSHNIPWQNLVDCYGIDDMLKERSMGIKSPRYAEFVDPLKKKIAYFIECFARTVDEFVITERRKYDIEKLKRIDDDIPLYSDTLCTEMSVVSGWNQYQLPGGAYQTMRHWLEMESSSKLNDKRVEEAQIIKVLIGSDNCEPLMRLAGRGVDLNSLRFMTYSNFFHYGSRRILEDALQLYIYVNLEIAKGDILAATREMYHRQFSRFILSNIMMGSDYDTQLELFFRPFFDQKSHVLKNGMESARELSKQCFRMIYQYAMIAAECGKPINVGKEVASVLCGSLDLDRLIDTTSFEEQ